MKNVFCKLTTVPSLSVVPYQCSKKCWKIQNCLDVSCLLSQLEQQKKLSRFLSVRIYKFLFFIHPFASVVVLGTHEDPSAFFIHSFVII